MATIKQQIWANQSNTFLHFTHKTRAYPVIHGDCLCNLLCYELSRFTRTCHHKVITSSQVLNHKTAQENKTLFTVKTQWRVFLGCCSSAAQWNTKLLWIMKRSNCNHNYLSFYNEHNGLRNRTIHFVFSECAYFIVMYSHSKWSKSNVFTDKYKFCHYIMTNITHKYKYKCKIAICKNNNK